MHQLLNTLRLNWGSWSFVESGGLRARVRCSRQKSVGRTTGSMAEEIMKLTSSVAGRTRDEKG